MNIFNFIIGYAVALLSVATIGYCVYAAGRAIWREAKTDRHPVEDVSLPQQPRRSLGEIIEIVTQGTKALFTFAGGAVILFVVGVVMLAVVKWAFGVVFD